MCGILAAFSSSVSARILFQMSAFSNDSILEYACGCNMKTKRKAFVFNWEGIHVDETLLLR